MWSKIVSIILFHTQHPTLPFQVIRFTFLVKFYTFSINSNQTFSFVLLFAPRWFRKNTTNVKIINIFRFKFKIKAVNFVIHKKKYIFLLN